MKDILIVGGGASGLIAAIVAAREGAKVTILEKLPRVGKKILATGNGRCNIGNRYSNIDRYHGQNKKFMISAMENFTVDAAIDFFEGIGVHIKEEQGGKLYPYSDQASSVLDCMRYEVNRLGIEEVCDAEVTSIRKRKSHFQAITKSGETYQGKKIIVAIGGKAAPNLGTKGAYELVESFGHSKTALFPALVQVCCQSNVLKSIKGVKVIGSCAIYANDQLKREEQGEILFTDYGISGPPVLQISRVVSEALHKKEKVYASLDLIPEYSFHELRDLLAFRITQMPYKTIEESLQGLFNKRLCLALLKVAGVDHNKKANELSKQEKNKLLQTCKAMKLDVTETKSWMNAQVTAGGIRTKEIGPQSMESRLVDGLYITGEILDIDGDCGGFNLQWAWASGYAAGKHAASQI